MDIRQVALISGFSASLFLLYAVYTAGRRLEDGKLRFGYWMLILGIACLAFVTFAIASVVLDPDVRADSRQVLAVMGIVLMLGSGALYCFVQFFFTRGNYDDEGIEFTTLLGGPIYGRWEDLKTIDYDHRGRSFTLKFRRGKVIRLSALISGHAGVLETASRHQFGLR